LKFGRSTRKATWRIRAGDEYYVLRRDFTVPELPDRPEVGVDL